MSTAVAEKVRRAMELITLAVNPAASREEARTAAWAAVTLIHKQGLRVVANGAPDPQPPPAPRPVPPQARIRVPNSAPVATSILYPSKYSGCCARCGKQYSVGTTIWWTPEKKARPIHHTCP